MKVVLLCGGSGMKPKVNSAHVPKAMVPIGVRPVIWNIMKYYAHYGHKEFILCLGQNGEMIKDYFLNYNKQNSNDPGLVKLNRNLELPVRDMEDWTLTFLDTGIRSDLSTRLLAAKEYIAGEDMFLANYCDGLTDLPLPAMINWFAELNDKTAAFMCHQPTQSLNIVRRRLDGLVNHISSIRNSGYLINSGYFVFRDAIFDYLKKTKDPVNEPFKHLIDMNRLVSWEHKGFWASLDTFQDKQILDELHAGNNAPWECWKQTAIPKSKIKKYG
jgi:glucose-1-phosphate cytidylyltransferase